ncbi:GNAT family N-acetyltransferase [Streptomyces verrucosisporus]|uniref:GNAT family N-acetyltransferase n=1 Tax=Streptomyces verrucosisporus TaxID=1695161 RepID=UPI0019D0CB85|nr:GNAT family N-acetyltransferase [Streptomyces verrucosisporus]MBN3928299.1 GNAT family N-acetyltransferase [Streptomyces verrucosisporus]
MLLRPVRDREDDAQAVRFVADAALLAPPSPRDPPPGRAPLPAPAVRRHYHTRHLTRTDPGGCWLAEDAAGRPVGVVLSARREGTWGLSLLAVLPEARGRGVGGALLKRALEYGRGCLRGIALVPPHPVAARVCRRAGLDLHPATRLTGTVSTASLPAPDGAVAAGGPGDRDLMDSVDRRLRGGAHGPDHEELPRHAGLLVTDDFAGSGYCYLSGGPGDPGGPGAEVRVELLGATSRRLATRLLTAALGAAGEGRRVRIEGLTAEQQWALDVGLAAGLEPDAAGWVGLRGMRPPSPYIPSAPFP